MKGFVQRHCKLLRAGRSNWGSPKIQETEAGSSRPSQITRQGLGYLRVGTERKAKR